MTAPRRAEDQDADRRRAFSFRDLLTPLIAASAALTPAAMTLAVGWGVVQARIDSQGDKIMRLERQQEESYRTDAIVLQRLSTLEGKIDGLRDLVRETTRRSEAR